jgi:hypothetical protein
LAFHKAAPNHIHPNDNPSGVDARSETRHHAHDEETFVTKLVTFILCLTPALLLAQNPVAGDWVLAEDIYGNPLYQRLTLKVEGPTLSGTLGRRSIDGTSTAARSDSR